MAFYEANALEQIAINLFYGWGYNFYKVENQLRADDLLVRAKVSWLLGLVHTDLETQQSAYRRKFLPPPTRENPRADSTALENARTLEELSASVSKIEGVIRALPVPENDRMTQRYRKEAATLLQLKNADHMLVGAANVMRAAVSGKDYTWILANTNIITAGVAFLQATIIDRQRLLQ